MTEQTSIFRTKGLRNATVGDWAYDVTGGMSSIFRTKGLRNATNELLYGIFYKVRLAYSEQRD